MAKKKHRSFGWLDGIIILLIAAGLGALCYPFVSDAYVSYQNQQLLTTRQQQETRKNDRQLQQEWQRYVQKNHAIAKADAAPGVATFNQAIDQNGTAKTQTPRDQQKLTTQTIAELTIPKINVSLPVFDHTTDWLLQFGACLLDGTSYPLGQKNSRAVISAHRGLANADLFTHLPSLKRGDKFYIKIAGYEYAYQVFLRQVIEPENTAALKVVPGQDLVTLMTCTPYMINSQRLLITGKRVPMTKADRAAIAATAWRNRLKLLLWGLIIAVLLWLLWRLLRGLIIASRHYQLQYVLHDATGAPMPGLSVQIRKGHRLLSTLVTDDNGAIATTLPGARYHLQVTSGEQKRRARAWVKHISDHQLTIKADRWRGTH